MIKRYRSSEIKLNHLYRVLGFSKQGVSQWRQRQERKIADLAVLEEAVNHIRKDHPGCGLEKMYHLLQPDCLGRDRFIAHFQSLGYGVVRKRNPIMTTRSLRDRYYPNLINSLTVNEVNQVWQTDITYILVSDRFYYLTFIIDVYSRLIVGYAVSDRLFATANVKALRMALKRREGMNLTQLIHHSDRGSQYLDRSYQQLLVDSGVWQISMCEQAQDNAYTERLNGIIKNEYINPWSPSSFEALKRMVKKAVNHYNSQRPHNGLKDRMPPEVFERWTERVDLEDRPTVVIRSYQPD